MKVSACCLLFLLINELEGQSLCSDAWAYVHLTFGRIGQNIAAMFVNACSPCDIWKRSVGRSYSHYTSQKLSNLQRLTKVRSSLCSL